MRGGLATISRSFIQLQRQCAGLLQLFSALRVAKNFPLLSSLNLKKHPQKATSYSVKNAIAIAPGPMCVPIAQPIENPLISSTCWS